MTFSVQEGMAFFRYTTDGGGFIGLGFSSFFNGRNINRDQGVLYPEFVPGLPLHYLEDINIENAISRCMVSIDVGA